VKTVHSGFRVGAGQGVRILAVLRERLLRGTRP
jgi:hypothetical protein